MSRSFIYQRVSPARDSDYWPQGAHVSDQKKLPDIATHLSNVVVWKYNGRYHKDPFSDYYGRVWDYCLLQEPLSKCFVTIRNRLKTEEVQKSLQGIFCGYGKDTNAYTVYISSSNTFTISGDVYFPKEDDYLDLLVDDVEANESSAIPKLT